MRTARALALALCAVTGLTISQSAQATMICSELLYEVRVGAAGSLPPVEKHCLCPTLLKGYMRKQPQAHNVARNLQRHDDSTTYGKGIGWRSRS